MISNEQLIGHAIDGKYRLDRLIGTGGMGAVYAGTHLQLSRQVAIKILRSDLVTDETMHARFVREARASARIEHLNAVRVYDFGALDELGSYLVMEYAEGISLRHLLAERGRLSLNLALDLVQQAAAALEAAHANGVIHRDVKPENLMVSFGADGRPILKVVDFGIAKLLSSDGTTQLTRPSDLIGTPRYMAPEQFTGEEIDGRIDVYALGIVLFELLTGRAPFEGTYSEIIGKHIYAEPPSFASLGVDLPAPVEHVVRRAIAKSPDLRPQTPIELAAELALACGPEIAAMAPPPLSYILQAPTGIALSVDPSEAATVGGSSTVVAGSPLAAVGERPPEAYMTHLGPTAVVDEVTHVRPSSRRLGRRPSARIVVPLGDGTTSVLDRARATAQLFVPPVLRARWAAPAVLALAGCISFGTFVFQGQSEASTAPDLTARPPIVETAPESAQPEVTTPPAAVVRSSRSESPAAVRRSEHRRADDEARRPDDNAFKKVGRALRLDRHLRRLF